jgi:hypothetical protein
MFLFFIFLSVHNCKFNPHYQYVDLQNTERFAGFSVGNDDIVHMSSIFTFFEEIVD